MLVYLLIGYTGGIDSDYLAAAAAAGGLGGNVLRACSGTLVFTALAAGALPLFLLVPRLGQVRRWSGPGDRGLSISCALVFLFMVGNLANILAEDLRVQSPRSTAARPSSSPRPTSRFCEAEEAVRRSDRLAALGQLSAGLAHELRNPLGTIKASAEMLNQQLSAENEVAREVAGFISTEVDRTNSLVTRFLQFARPLQLRLDNGRPDATAGPRHHAGRTRGARTSRSTRTTRPRFRPSPSMPS